MCKPKYLRKTLIMRVIFLVGSLYAFDLNHLHQQGQTIIQSVKYNVAVSDKFTS